MVEEKVMGREVRSFVVVVQIKETERILY